MCHTKARNLRPQTAAGHTRLPGYTCWKDTCSSCLLNYDPEVSFKVQTRVVGRSGLTPGHLQSSDVEPGGGGGRVNRAFRECCRVASCCPSRHSSTLNVHRGAADERDHPKCELHQSRSSRRVELYSASRAGAKQKRKHRVALDRPGTTSSLLETLHWDTGDIDLRVMLQVRAKRGACNLLHVSQILHVSVQAPSATVVKGTGRTCLSQLLLELNSMRSAWVMWFDLGIGAEALLLRRAALRWPALRTRAFGDPPKTPILVRVRAAQTNTNGPSRPLAPHHLRGSPSAVGALQLDGVAEVPPGAFGFTRVVAAA